MTNDLSTKHPDSRKKPNVTPKTPQKKPTATFKALKTSAPTSPQNIPIFWNEDSFNGPGQPRGNITPTSAPPTGFEPQL